MTDYKEKFDDLHRAAKQKARELDEKLNVSGIVEDTARVAGDAARRSAKSIAEGAEQLRAEAGRMADDPKVREAADEAKRHAKEAGKAIRDAASDAGKIIRDAAGPAGKKQEKLSTKPPATLARQRKLRVRASRRRARRRRPRPGS